MKCLSDADSFNRRLQGTCISARRVEVPPEEIVDLAFGMSCGDGLEGGVEMGEGFNAVDLRSLDQRGDATPGTPALVMPCERRIFAIERNGADQVFNAIGVDLDAPGPQPG
ncbi:hypothetical protein BZA02_12313 [Ruegeria sp. P4]|nr:hypothetical protein BZA02_12313 [Ruegeria sp. P4]